MNHVVDYTKYVIKQLEQVPRTTIKLAAYNTGSGLTISPEQGSEISALTTMQTQIVHIDTPRKVVGAEGDDWDNCWDAGIALVNAFIAERNR